MSRLGPLSRELGRILGALVLGFLGVTVLALSLDKFGVSEPSRIARKLLVPIVIGLYAALLRVRWDELPFRAGLLPTEGLHRRVLIGFAAGVASLVAMNLVLIAAGARRFEPELTAERLAVKTFLYLLQALGLGLLEESLFRGFLHGRLYAAGGSVAALVLGSLLFAGSHFLRPPKALEDGPAWRVALDCFAGLGEIPVLRWREFVGLGFVGAVLVVARLRSGAIWLPLGIHAGWVWVRLVADKALAEVEPVVAEHPIAFGTMRHYDGILGWGALVLTLALLGAFRCRSPESSFPSQPDSKKSRPSP